VSRGCLSQRLTAAVVLIAAAGLSSPIRALEQPPAFTDADRRIGVDMTPLEAEEAREFCQETLARNAAAVVSFSRACSCFVPAWEARTNRLHRLALPIAVAPDSPEARRNLALIFRAQGGIRDDQLRQLSSEYQLAAKQAFRACL
jgi:hypothetical protein